MTANAPVLAHTEQSNQLNLPSGPVGLVRPRRERADVDREWHSEQVKVQIQNVHYREVWRQMVFLASCNPGRLCYAAHATIARKAGTDDKALSTKTVQRAVKFLQSEGLIECLSVGACRVPGKYLVLGRVHVDSKSMSRGLKVHQIEEGIEVKAKNLLSAVPKSLDPVEPEGPKQEVLPTVFPSPKKQEKEPLPMAQEPSFKNRAQVGMLYSVARKLDYSLSDAEALRFDGMEHTGRKALLDRLLAEEQEAALRGEVEAPPKKPREPRAEVAVERKPKPDRPSCVEHRWTQPASDGISNCFDCDEERNER